MPRTLSEQIVSAVSARSMLAHPFYRAWEAGDLSMDALKAYAAQYFHHVEAFPQAVSAVHANCPDPAGRRYLAENLAEEEGVAEGKQDHATLWLGFAEALGADEASVRATLPYPETQALIAAFRTLSRQSYAAGLGALFAYETQLPAIARTKVQGLVERYGIQHPDALRFFTVHEAVDVEHATVCGELLNALPQALRAEAHHAACALAHSLLGFLDGMERERLN